MEVKNKLKMYSKNISGMYATLIEDSKLAVPYMDILLNIVWNIPNLYTIGRPGTYCYNNIDACADVARLLAKHINENKSKEEWHALDEYFENYRIID